MATHALPRARRKVRPGTRLAASLLAGQIAGIAMLVFLALMSVIFRHAPFLLWLRLIASLFAGRAAIVEPHPLALLVAFVIHQLGPSLLWSLAFFWITLTLRRTFGVAESLILGLMLGAVAMLIDVYLLLPLIQSAAYREPVWQGYVSSGWAWVAHLVFGAVLGVGYVRIRQALVRSARSSELRFR